MGKLSKNSYIYLTKPGVMEDLLIKDNKGKTLPLLVFQENDTIILSKKNDKSPETQKRRVKVFIVSKNKVEAFQKVEVKDDEERKSLGEVLYQLICSIRQIRGGSEMLATVEVKEATKP